MLGGLPANLNSNCFQSFHIGKCHILFKLSPSWLNLHLIYFSLFATLLDFKWRLMHLAEMKRGHHRTLLSEKVRMKTSCIRLSLVFVFYLPKQLAGVFSDISVEHSAAGCVNGMNQSNSQVSIHVPTLPLLAVFN